MYTPKSLKINNIISIVDTVYEFRNGVAIIIVGKNYDNPSQKSNGVGKSALIESLALAYTGTSIRDVKVKELINRQAKDGEVELIQYNSQTKLEMKIWRKFYSGTKSAECRIWIGDKEIRLSDINAYNKFIFDEIGLSKEDFFNFYLLVQANYQPFLRVGDTKKKEIINRFSGADTIDYLIPYVKFDCAQIAPEEQQLTQTLAEESARQTIYQESIDELNEKNKTLSEQKNEQIQDLRDKIVAVEEQRELTVQDSNVQQQHIDRTVKEIGELCREAFEQDLAEFKAEINIERGLLNADNDQKKLDISKVQDTFGIQIASIQLDEKQATNTINQLSLDINEFEKLESDINKQMQDSVECPKCAHKFSIRNVDFNYNEAVEQLPFIVNEISTMKAEVTRLRGVLNNNIHKRKQDINKAILTKQDAIRVNMTANNAKLAEILIKEQETDQTYAATVAKEVELINAKKSFQNKIAFNVQTDDQLKRQQDALRDEIAQIEAYTIAKELQELQDKQAKGIAHQDEIKLQLDAVQQRLSQTAQWETNFKNFKSYVANQSIANIQDYAIRLDGFSELASGKLKEQISVEVLRGGFSEGSYGAFSGGERGRIDVCTILAIQQLINLNCKNGGLDLLICDEILDQIDTLGLESIINSLQNLDRTIMIVSQNDINTLKDYTLTIEKRNKISTFVN
jgi:exonuclease SbcC